MEAAFVSSILYGCENWLKVLLKSIELLYMTAVKVNSTIEIMLDRNWNHSSSSRFTEILSKEIL